MGDGRIFLKSRRDVSFKKGLSNEPTFGLIHLAGQYLEKFEDFLVYTGKGRGVDLENPPNCEISNSIQGLLYLLIRDYVNPESYIFQFKDYENLNNFYSTGSSGKFIIIIWVNLL
jgi:hypothetical protein